MSGIVGVYNRDGRPVDKDLLFSMTNALAHRGPDGAGHWINGSVGMGHRMFCTTLEAEYETQPWVDEHGHYCLTFDGRVDNRKELAAMLMKERVQLRNDTDAELILAAYIQWGRSCAVKIIGDFAFVIWDGQRDELYCVRDYLGIRPLYYYCDDRRFIWGSELHQFFIDQTVPKVANEGRVGEYLAALPRYTDETLFSGIFRVPSRHYLIVNSSGVRKIRYWDFDPDYTVDHKNDSDYAECFLELYKEAVRCRLRCNSKVGSDLSGGLDSSSIVSIVQSLRQEGVVSLDGFETFSDIYPGLECDESRYINDVVKKWGVKATKNFYGIPSSETLEDEARRSSDIPDVPNGFLRLSTKSWANSCGVKVMLTGDGGDDLVSGSDYYYGDLLQRWRLFEFLRLIRNDWNTGYITNPMKMIYAYGIKPLIPQRVRTSLKPLYCKTGYGEYINRTFANNIDLDERMRLKPTLPGTSILRSNMYSIFSDGYNGKVYEMRDRLMSLMGVESRHPCLDRRLVTYCLALPFSQYRRGTTDRYILKEAMKGVLPESVRTRKDKADFTHLLMESLQAHGGERLFKSLALAANGWVDEKKLCGMYREAEHLFEHKLPNYGMRLWQLWMVYVTDMWWRASFTK